MNRFSDELRVIPRPAWLIALLVYACLFTLLYTYAMPKDPELRQWPGSGKILFSAGIPIFLFVYVLLIGYVNGDARRRGMRHVMWTLLAIFIPNAIGIILYFIFRDPLLEPCRQCGNMIRSSLAFCPNCGAALAKACPQCRLAVEANWSHCGHCGVKL